MTPGAVAARLVLIGAAWTASRLARVVAVHRAVATALWLTFALDLLRLALREAGAPVEVLRALYLGHPALSVWLAAVVLWVPPEDDGESPFLPPPMRVVIWGTAMLWWVGEAAWVAVLQMSRAEFALRAQVVGAEALAIETVLVVYRFRRLRAPTFTELVVLMFVAGDLANVLGAWLYADVWSAWDLNRWQLAVVFGVVWYGQARRRAWVMTFAPKSARGSSRSARPSRSSRS